jgi:hypothetical protein
MDEEAEPFPIYTLGSVRPDPSLCTNQNVGKMPEQKKTFVGNGKIL